MIKTYGYSFFKSIMVQFLFIRHSLNITKQIFIVKIQK